MAQVIRAMGGTSPTGTPADRSDPLASSTEGDANAGALATAVDGRAAVMDAKAAATELEHE